MDSVSATVTSRAKQHEIFLTVKPLSSCPTCSSHTKMFYVMDSQPPPVSYTSAVLTPVIGSFVDGLSDIVRQLEIGRAHV